MEGTPNFFECSMCMRTCMCIRFKEIFQCSCNEMVCSDCIVKVLCGTCACPVCEKEILNEEKREDLRMFVGLRDEGCGDAAILILIRLIIKKKIDDLHEERLLREVSQLKISSSEDMN